MLRLSFLCCASGVALADLAHDEARVALLLHRAEKPVARLSDPRRDVFGRAGVAGEHGEHAADRQRLDAADQLHERPGAEAAAGVDLFVDLHRLHVYHLRFLPLVPRAGTWHMAGGPTTSGCPAAK